MGRCLEIESRSDRSCSLLGRQINGQVEGKSIFLGENKEILDPDLWAISEALDIAEKIANPKMPVTIWSDSHKALRAIGLLCTSQGNLLLRGHVFLKKNGETSADRTSHYISVDPRSLCPHKK